MTQAAHMVLHSLYIKIKDECIALFGRSGWPGLKPQFIRWNESVENQTTYKTEESLLNAYVCDVEKTSEDFIVIQLLPF